MPDNTLDLASVVFILFYIRLREAGCKSTEF
jgi:hypothetical protein